MGSFGTGLPPGRHGLVGYEVMDPDRGVLLNELRWDPATDPLRWQPLPDRVPEAGRRRGPGHPDRQPGIPGSGLTTAALRGGGFVGPKRLRDRVDVAVDGCAEPAGAGLPVLGRRRRRRARARLAVRRSGGGRCAVRPGAGPAGPAAAAGHAAGGHRRPRHGRRAARRPAGPGHATRPLARVRRARRRGPVRRSSTASPAPPARRRRWPRLARRGRRPGLGPHPDGGDRRRAGSVRSRIGAAASRRRHRRRPGTLRPGRFPHRAAAGARADRPARLADRRRAAGAVAGAPA